MSAIEETKSAFEELQEKYRKHFPKVNTKLLDSLLAQQAKDPSGEPIFTVEVFTKPDMDANKVRDYIMEKTGMSPAIFDKGTHYVTSQKLTLEALKEISDSDDVLEITGEYTGRIGAYGSAHEHRETEDTRGKASGRGSPPSSEVT